MKSVIFSSLLIITASMDLIIKID